MIPRVFRYWISWWTDIDPATVETPFKTWVSGWRNNPVTGDYTTMSVCALMELGSPRPWKVVKEYFSDYEGRFCREVDENFNPGDRFQ